MGVNSNVYTNNIENKHMTMTMNNENKINKCECMTFFFSSVAIYLFSKLN